MENILHTDFMAKSVVLLFTTLMLMLTACEGPAGSQGPQGPEGTVGPVGPAGEDGSVMWAGPDEPPADIGAAGDYYLNSTTGEFYGPKGDGGWGKPIIVLMGDDGQDGADGEDGTKIHSGSGAPEASLGVKGDFYIDLANQDLYGPKTGNGWGSPVSLNGADGQDGADGEDGSQIYAGDGPPDASKGKTGDYYLDQTNKDLYGPKTKSGWGIPINLNGADGQDGKDGADGKDGSRIYAGAGPPSVFLGSTGDFYLDKTNYDLYGPKAANKGGKPVGLWGTPINIKGTANVIYSDWVSIQNWIINTNTQKYGSIPNVRIPSNIIQKGAIMVYMKWEPDNPAAIPYIAQLPHDASAGRIHYGSSIVLGSRRIHIEIKSSGITIPDGNYKGPGTLFRYVIIPGGVAAEANTTIEEIKGMPYSELEERFGIQ